MPLMELLPGSHAGPAAGAMGSAHSGGLSGVGRERKQTVSTGGGGRGWGEGRGRAGRREFACGA